MGTESPPPKGGRAPSPIFGPFLLWPNGWMHQDATWYGCRPLPRGLCVSWRTSPLPKRERPPQNFFLAHDYCGQMARWIKMSLGTKVGLSPSDSVRWGPSPPPHKGGGAPLQFSVRFCYGQTAGCIKMPLGMEVGLSSGDFVLDGDPAPLPKKEAERPIFGPRLLWPNGWTDRDGTWHGARPWSSPHCAGWGHSSPPQKGGRASQFSAHLYCGQTAGCIKMPLGMEVDLCPGDFVLDGDQAPYPKGAEPHPIFGPRLLWPNNCVDQDATWCGGRPRPA